MDEGCSRPINNLKFGHFTFFTLMLLLLVVVVVVAACLFSHPFIFQQGMANKWKKCLRAHPIMYSLLSYSDWEK